FRSAVAATAARGALRPKPHQENGNCVRDLLGRNVGGELGYLRRQVGRRNRLYRPRAGSSVVPHASDSTEGISSTNWAFSPVSFSHREIATSTKRGSNSMA